jgi:hypothetical protein
MQKVTSLLHALLCTALIGCSGSAQIGQTPNQGKPLPKLHVAGNTIQDPTGKTIILRGGSLIDLGALAAVNSRIDNALNAGLIGHVIRLPVYPRTEVNGNSPYYSPVPFPIGPAAPGSANLGYTPKDQSNDAYVSTVLKPAVDYAVSKSLYVIIAYHQIDDTSGASGSDATAFWTYMAPKFKDYPNVIYETFSEPIDTAAGSSPEERWAAYKPRAQTWVDAIRAGAPDNLIIVGAPNWSQDMGAAGTSPLNGTNLVYAAHVYPGNWSQSQIDACAAAHPVFLTEWGFQTDSSDALLKADAAWASDFRKYVDTRGVSWTAWALDDHWPPPLFAAPINAGNLTDFGKMVKEWLAAKATSDWVQ